MSKVILLLFDLDATLVRTGGAGMRAMNQAFAEIMNWPNALAEISPAGRTDPSIAHEISRKHRGHEMTTQELERVFSRYLELLKEKICQTDNYRVLPGIQSFLEGTAGSREYLLGLGTGNLEAGARIKLEPAKLNRFFSFGGFGSDAVERADILRIAIQRAEANVQMKITSEQVVVIGDTPHDVEAGKTIGAKTIAVATGPYTAHQLAVFEPDLVLADFREKSALDAFFSRLRAWDQKKADVSHPEKM